jgi:hypothetical protein
MSGRTYRQKPISACTTTIYAPLRQSNIEKGQLHQREEEDHAHCGSLRNASMSRFSHSLQSRLDNDHGRRGWLRRAPGRKLAFVAERTIFTKDAIKDKFFKIAAAQPKTIIRGIVGA